MKSIVVTGVHLTPVLPVVKLMQGGDLDIHYIGRKSVSESSTEPSIESKIIPSLGIKFYSITPSRFQRRMTLAGLRSLIRAPLAFWQAYRLLGQIKPQLVVSFGGYIGLFVSLAAFIKNIPVILHEQASIPGLSNRISAVFARQIAISWKNTTGFPPRKTVYTGNPIRKELLQSALSKTRKFVLNSRLPTILVTGGNQGSHHINQLLIPSLPELMQFTNVIFQTGSINISDYEDAMTVTKTNSSPGRVHIGKYFDSREMGEAVNRADLVIGRSGANTVTELAALGKPAILIPLPWSGGGEQPANAKLLLPYGSIIINQSDLTSELLIKAISTQLKDLDRIKILAEQSRRLVNLDADKDLFKLIIKNLDEIN